MFNQDANRLTATRRLCEAERDPAHLARLGGFLILLGFSCGARAQERHGRAPLRVLRVAVSQPDGIVTTRGFTETAQSLSVPGL
jgi:hypothetical protein